VSAITHRNNDSAATESDDHRRIDTGYLTHRQCADEQLAHSGYIIRRALFTNGHQDAIEEQSSSI
jgi:hypothetical protein